MFQTVTHSPVMKSIVLLYFISLHVGYCICSHNVSYKKPHKYHNLLVLAVQYIIVFLTTGLSLSTVSPLLVTSSVQVKFILAAQS